MTKQPDQGWRDFVLGSLPRMEANDMGATGFTPGPQNPQPLSFAGPHIAPPDDPLVGLPDAAATKLVALGQVATDLHGAIPSHEQVQEVRLEAIGLKNRFDQLVGHRSTGGFEQDPSAPQVVDVQRKLSRVEKELGRLLELKEVRTIRWTAAAQLHQAVRDWTSRGIPGGCTLDVVPDAPVAELLKKNETVAAAVERFRHRLRELAADRHRVNSSPWPSSVAKAAAKEFIDRLASEGAPNFDGAIEHGMDIILATKRLTSSVFNVNSPGAIAYGETDHTTGFLCWLWPDQIFSKICAGLDEISDDKNALDQQQRETMFATIDADCLSAERSECSLIWAAAALGGEVIDFRATTSAQAVLGVALRTLASAAPPETSLGHAWDVVGPGLRK